VVIVEVTMRRSWLSLYLVWVTLCTVGKVASVFCQDQDVAEAEVEEGVVVIGQGKLRGTVYM
jgi:hypothetical protein